MTLDEAIQELDSRPNGFRCHELVDLLLGFRFRVRDGSKGGHKIVSHPELKGWFGTHFNCGHNNGAMVKSPYVRTIRRVLDENRDALAVILKGNAND